MVTTRSRKSATSTTSPTKSRTMKATTAMSRKKAPSAFINFDKLPTELRLGIWQDAYRESPDSQPATIYSPHLATLGSTPPLVTVPASPSLMLACKEASEAGKTPSHRSRPFQPHHDMLIVTHRTQDQLSAALKAGACADWLREVTHLGIQIPGVGYTDWGTQHHDKIMTMMRLFTKLQTISVVFPRTKTGTFDHRQAVAQITSAEARGQNSLSARRLGGEELRDCRVTCDVWDDPGGACPGMRYEWDKSGDEYVAFLQNTLRNELHYQRWKDGGWNGSRKKPDLELPGMKVKFHACLVSRVDEQGRLGPCRRMLAIPV